MRQSIDLAASLHSVHLTCIEPIIIAARKPRRLAAFGVASAQELPFGDIDLSYHHSGDCAAEIAVESRYLERYLSDAPGWLPNRFRGVAAVVDLDSHADFPSYEAKVRRRSKGGVLRQIRRARDAGFRCKTFYPEFYRRQRFEIETSKLFRSGLVLASILAVCPASDFPDGIAITDVAEYLGLALWTVADGSGLRSPPPPACPKHWQIGWGVFVNESIGGGSRERLIGYILLRRTGNIVRTAGFMGHGLYLRKNVMKLLFHEVMAWLLTRADPSTIGVRYLLYGAVEHGNDGLFAWKRSFAFSPIRLRWAGTRLPGAAAP